MLYRRKTGNIIPNKYDLEPELLATQQPTV
jgi:hypothetical protein